MHLAQQFALLLHFVGFAALFGGVLVQLRDHEPEVNQAMVAGAWIELATGISLFVLLLVGTGPVAVGWWVVRLALTLFVLVLVLANRKYAFIPRGLWALIGGLSLLVTAIGVFGQ